MYLGNQNVMIMVKRKLAVKYVLKDGKLEQSCIRDQQISV